jgi:RimJ/RimL family protein N-acetyltransferase
MAVKQDLIYRQLITLKDGTRVLLRPLIPEDRQALIDLFAPISANDKLYFRTDLSDNRIVSSWVDNINYEKVLPIVAVMGDRLVGDATLHFHAGPQRHIAEVRLFLGSDFRQRGLGSKMLNALIDIARRKNLYILEAQVVADQQQVVRAFQNVGFIVKSTFEDYFMLPDGTLCDLTYLMMRLHGEEDQF